MQDEELSQSSFAGAGVLVDHVRRLPLRAAEEAESGQQVNLAVVYQRMATLHIDQAEDDKRKLALYHRVAVLDALTRLIPPGGEQDDHESILLLAIG